ncbi:MULTISPECIES: ABC transporter ATP-binding protein [unclassified Streptomyces]|uniref:ABC transporter ATP-binding protein n=1 Tax=unclassified Streptomyces TaxID=2593676 RepID=UPI00224DF55E|nr:MULTISPECIES: ABC transporter ATP-binding protein [unclassified Streptomyces]MCX5053075.1 ABC transporter ATP-binding protein [Streptomyces sp. NBC_00474]
MSSRPNHTGADPLVRVSHLSLDIPVRGEPRRVLHDVSFEVGAGEALGLVGESGSGKSMTTRVLMRLLPYGSATGGDVLFDGTSVTAMDRRALRSYRASEVAMIYQDPRAAINPVRTVGDFLTEALREAKVTRREAEERAVTLLREVGITDAPRRMRQYPHQLSGGLLQRVMIASAMLTRPRLLIADEPTTALDVTTQEEVMAILDEQRRERGLALVFITHDLDLAAAVTDRIAVMYAGTVLETAASKTLHETALHPYTVGLLASRPSTVDVKRLWAIPGRPVSAFEAGPGCVFADRCPFAQDLCREERPALRTVDDHQVACHRAEELRGRITYEPGGHADHQHDEQTETV